MDDLAEDEDDALSCMGPNGSLVFCMEYIANNLENLQEAIDGGEDEYFVFDCPGMFMFISVKPISFFQVKLSSTVI